MCTNTLINWSINQSINQSILSLRSNGHFPNGPNLADTIMSSFRILLELRMMEVLSDDNWSCKTCKAPVKSPPTNQHPTFSRSDALPVAQPTVSEHWEEVWSIGQSVSQPISHQSSLHSNGHFPSGPNLADTRMSPFRILLELRMMEVVVTTGAIGRAKLQSIHHHQQTNTQFFLQAGCPSCHPTNSVR